LTCHTPSVPKGSDNSPEVFSPTGHSTPGVHSARACLTRYVPLSGFLNLLADSSSRSLLALFHASNPLGVHPPGLFPLEELVPFRALFLSCRSAISWKSQDTLGFCPGSASLGPIFRAITAPPDRAGSSTSVRASGIVPEVVQRFPRSAFRQKQNSLTNETEPIQRRACEFLPALPKLTLARYPPDRLDFRVLLPSRDRAARREFVPPRVADALLGLSPPLGFSPSSR